MPYKLRKNDSNKIINTRDAIINVNTNDNINAIKSINRINTIVAISACIHS